jgi:hypothetical protein
VDESGNQVAVFGRRGGRPLNLAEMQRMYLREGGNGEKVIWTVPDGTATTPGRTTAPHPVLMPAHEVRRRR